MRDDVRIWKHSRCVLLDRIAPCLESQGERGGVVEVLFAELHNLEAGVNVCQLDHRGINEEEILGSVLLIASYL